MAVDIRQQEARRFVGERFRELRESLGISAQRVAKAAGLSRQYVHLVEKGGANITLDTYVDMLSACGLSFDDFLRNMQMSDIPPAHQDAHQWLEEILNSELRTIREGVLINLRGMALLARSLRYPGKKHTSPAPGDQPNGNPPFSAPVSNLKEDPPEFD